MKAFITKYALTTGIQEVDAKEVGGPTKMITWKGESDWCESTAHYEGRDWCRTRESAISRADEMRVKKIASLKKSIKKLEVLEFI